VTECFESTVVEVPFDAPASDAWSFLNVYCDGPKHEITRTQFALSAPAQAPAAISKLQDARSGKMTIKDSDVKETADTLTIGFLTWSKKTGELVSIKPEGKELLAAPAEEIFYRAPTCNDRMMDHDGSFAKDWPKIINPKRELVSFEWKKDGGMYTVIAKTRIGGAVESVIVWTVDPAKAHLLNFHQYALFRQNDLRSVARVGMMFPLVEGFETAKYFGRGPYENYPDRFVASLVGRWENNISDMLENYLVPSECGSRGDVVELNLTGKGGQHLGVWEDGGKPFRFSALHLSQQDLMAADHSWELKPGKKTWLILDGFHMGVGGDDGWSVSVHNEYQLRPNRYEWSCTLDFRKPE
jgi:beta-galactosidase